MEANGDHVATAAPLMEWDKMGLEERARAFAVERHGGQIRKYTGYPYTTHLLNVANLVRGVPHTEEMLAAAWLHDTLEDTNTTGDEILVRFGPVVLLWVKFLTDRHPHIVGNRATRKQLYRDWLAGAPPEVKTIKLADLIDNSSTIVEHDPGFAKVYMSEKKALLAVLQDGAAALLREATMLVDGYYRTSNM